MSGLTWLCGKCGEPIGDEDGGVRVTHAEIAEHRRTECEYERAHGGEAVDLYEFLLVPPDIAWTPLHYRCDEERGDAYCLGVARLATYRDLVTWTAHLMSKNWIGLTDWDQVLREAAGEAHSVRVMVEANAP